MQRVATNIAATLIVGGQIAQVTLHVANTIELLREDVENGTFVIRSFAYGAEWDSIEPPRYAQVPNYVAPQYAHRMEEEIRTEMESGRYVPVSRDAVVGIAAVGIVDKGKSGMKKVRIVHDLSRPTDFSVNNLTEIEKRKFATVKQACDYLRPRAWQAKTDLSKAYRSIPTAPKYWRVHVLEWNGVIYSDLRLPFGNRAAPGVFDRLTQTIVRVVRRLGWPFVLGYIDDFYITTPPDEDDIV